MQPNFSTYPWDRVPKLSRRAATLQSILARWIGARTTLHPPAPAPRLTKLLTSRDGAADLRARVVDDNGEFDPYAAACTVRISGVDLHVLGSSGGVRAIAQRLLGGPAELASPRPLGVVERSLWSLVVATALEDFGVAGHVWPDIEGNGVGTGDGPSSRIGLDVSVGNIEIAVVLVVPAGLELRVPRAHGGVQGVGAAWIDRVVFEVPLVVGRCALHRDDVARLAPRQVITLDAPSSMAAVGGSRVRPHGEIRADLEVGEGAVGVIGKVGELGVAVSSGYVARDMGLPDDAHVELSVALGTTRMSLRQLTELSIGQIVSLGRPLAGPFEVRAQGRVLGRGELVDVDGELAVRIVSLGDQEL